MATFLRRNTLFYNQLRQMHGSTGGSNVPTYNMNAEKKAFVEVLPEVINPVVTSPRLNGLPEVQSWMKKLLEYTVGVGKLGRGLMNSIGYRMFEEPENFSEETLHSARVLGWCTEMMVPNFLIMDDMADHSMTRRGQPCWHLQPNLSLNGVMDALLLYQSTLDVLDIYFGRTPIYGDLLRIFNENGKEKAIKEIGYICLELGRLLQIQFSTILFQMAALLRRKTLFFKQLRTLHRSAVASSVPITLNMYKNREKFNEMLPAVTDYLMTSPKFTNQLPEVGSWVKQLISYTIVGGKQGRGLAVPFAYRKMEDPKYFTEEKLHTAQFLGWAIEMMQGFILSVDDIIDASTTRRGKPCWYLLPSVGTCATNDCVLIYHCFMEFIEMKFGKEPFYPDLIKYANEAIMYTTIGQFLDHSSGYTKEKNNLDGFTMERFDAIAIQKTGYYSFRLPTLAALFLVKNGKEKYTSEFNSICMECGKLMQFQNDYKDVYWDETITGKAGTDIQEGKLSWISVTALERCNEAQRAIFKEYYGSKDPEHVKRIRQLYDELDMKKVYETFLSSFLENLERRIRALPTEGETEYFLEVMEACRNQIY